MCSQGHTFCLACFLIFLVFLVFMLFSTSDCVGKPNACFLIVSISFFFSVCLFVFWVPSVSFSLSVFGIVFSFGLANVDSECVQVTSSMWMMFFVLIVCGGKKQTNRMHSFNHFLFQWHHCFLLSICGVCWEPPHVYEKCIRNHGLKDPVIWFLSLKIFLWLLLNKFCMILIPPLE